MRLLPYGDRAVLVEVDDPATLAGLSCAVRRAEGVLAARPAARTLLVHFDPVVTTVEALGQALETYPVGPAAAPARDPVELSVYYDGPDLAVVADEVGISVVELVARHVGPLYTVAFCGFAPGFAYLTGLDPSLHVGRLAEPRTAVPPGSVGVADEFTGVYPRSSPGGWRLLGRTEAPLWDTARVPPALLTPGTPVRFCRA